MTQNTARLLCDS